jgi:hypothetical protein
MATPTPTTPVIKPKTFRYDFSPSIVKLINDFAFTHKFSNKKTYYDNWHDDWLVKNEKEIQKEIERITNEGYVGGIKDKMYKAGRYYFRKKHINTHNKNKLSKQISDQVDAKAEQVEAKAEEVVELVEQTDKTDIDTDINKADNKADNKANAINNKTAAIAAIVNKKRTYITIQKELLKIMDTHIRNGLQDKLTVFKPEHGFGNFYENHVTSIRTEIQRLLTNYKFEPTQTIDKLKKTYKNRYYIATRK